LITSSVTIRSRLTALADTAVPPLTRTCSEIGRLSPIIEAARLSHSLDR
jgi:hypothetical protein